MAFNAKIPQATRVLDAVLAIVFTIAGGLAVVVALNQLLPSAINNLSSLLTTITTINTGNAFFNAMLTVTGIITAVLGAFWILGLITEALSTRYGRGGSS